MSYFVLYTEAVWKAVDEDTSSNSKRHAHSVISARSRSTVDSQSVIKLDLAK